MLRTLSRAIGFLLLAAGFVGVVFDGARSIANNALHFTGFGEFAGSLLKERYGAFQASAEAGHSTLWQFLGAPLAGAPVSLVAVVLGIVLLWLGQPARDPFLTFPHR